MSDGLDSAAIEAGQDKLIHLEDIQRGLTLENFKSLDDFRSVSDYIDAFDVACVNKGAVFRVPITVIRPQKISARLHRPELESLNTLFYPNYIRRNFVLVPENATWAVLKLHCREKDKSGRFVIHAVQLRPKLVCKTLEFHKICTVSSQNDVFQGFSVRGGLVLELVIAKYWANIGEVALDYSMSFHGVKPDNSLIAMQGAEGVFSVELSSRLRSEQIAPSASLKNSVQMLRPNEAKIVPLSARDVIPQSRQIYELQLSYNFHISKGTEIVPIRLLFFIQYMVKVEKGDYILKMHVRHERKELLDKLLDKQLLLSQKLAVPISLDIYASLSRATTGGKKMSVATISQGQILPVYIAPLNNEK
uniref:Uncharacterized protein n=1 Tax=Timema tahoe TaxID=61484 RepID=A0A7R9IG35_9NEOP|nr:unnamed protein product [Timema tahoe]